MRIIKNRNNDGRPKLPLTEKKGYKVTVKFATAEYYSLKNKAKEAGMNLSLFVRNTLQGSEVRQRFSAEHLHYILQMIGMANDNKDDIIIAMLEYERAVQEKAALDEQNRLRQLEAEKLNHEAEKLKKK